MSSLHFLWNVFCDLATSVPHNSLPQNPQFLILLLWHVLISGDMQLGEVCIRSTWHRINRALFLFVSSSLRCSRCLTRLRLVSAWWHAASTSRTRLRKVSAFALERFSRRAQ
ncbi:hypothetical protein M405DRAFT_535356 [Rhizopogon salebrosus TDB-379]|nr:hypothetical protein M405DRAFT_535356 [Rhizopogon salebrosus TDB-379]